MAQPTLTLAASVITLPYPDANAKNDRTYEEQRINRRTIGGLLRTTVLSANYKYTLGFRYADPALYDAIVTMWTNAVASMVWPTFAWVAGPWPSADGVGVIVALEIGPLTRPSPLFTFADYSLTLTEVNPR